MNHWQTYTAFAIASVVLAVTPGPAVFYIVTRSLSQGRRAGLASVAGVALGNLGNALGASLGLAALFAISALAFWVVKYAGAAYLIYLGIRAWRSPARLEASQPRAAAQPGRVFRDGLVVALLNPKTALFFSAFLPQFIDPQAPALTQSLLLSVLFILIASSTDTLYALTAGAVAPLLARRGRALPLARYLTAGAFIGLGVLTAVSGSRQRH
ncbi:MAG TPA: LysE family translocator [Candidatus Dormibacteraeota bacterium]|nr:LysE family translocator [Candidatus Dormibacteraeota bacterium]